MKTTLKKMKNLDPIYSQQPAKFLRESGQAAGQNLARFQPGELGDDDQAMCVGSRRNKILFIKEH